MTDEERRERLRKAQDASIAELEAKFGALTEHEKCILRIGFVDGSTYAYTLSSEIIEKSFSGVKA